MAFLSYELRKKMPILSLKTEALKQLQKGFGAFALKLWRPGQKPHLFFWLFVPVG